MLAITEILEEHLEEASFCWMRWEQALHAHNYDLAETAEWEERLLAHVDGLVVAGAAAESLLLPAFESEEATLISAAASALLADRGKGRGKVLAHLHTVAPEFRPALERALELSDSPGLDEQLVQLLGADDPEVFAVVLRTLVARNTLPPSHLERLLEHESPEVRAAALGASASLHARSPRPAVILACLGSAHAGLRLAAIEAGLVWGLRAALSTCRELVKAGAAGMREAMVLMALGGTQADTALLAEAAEEPEQRPHALWALGFSGHLSAAEACLHWLEDTTVATLAGEAFSAITGLRLNGSYALPPEEQQEEPVPMEEENLDADLVPKPEDALPRPEPHAVRQWWEQNNSRFQHNSRYLYGKPLNAAALLRTLESGPMRRRHVWARELLLRGGWSCRVRTRSLTHRQLADLARAKAAETHISMQPFEQMLR